MVKDIFDITGASPKDWPTDLAVPIFNKEEAWLGSKVNNEVTIKIGLNVLGPGKHGIWVKE